MDIETSRTDKIAKLHNEIVGHLQTSLQKAIRIGELLTEQKATLRHGQFTAWISQNLPFTDRTARNYMRVFREKDKLKTETVSDLKSAYRLLAAPNGDWENEATGDMTHNELVAICFKICFLKNFGYYCGVDKLPERALDYLESLGVDFGNAPSFICGGRCTQQWKGYQTA